MISIDIASCGLRFVENALGPNIKKLSMYNGIAYMI